MQLEAKLTLEFLCLTTRKFKNQVLKYSTLKFCVFLSNGLNVFKSCSLILMNSSKKETDNHSNLKQVLKGYLKKSKRRLEKIFNKSYKVLMSLDKSKKNY